MSSSLATAPAAQPCPCGRLHGSGNRARPLAYADCCGRYVDSAATPAVPARPTVPAAGSPDAESLMRSRYTAFVLQRADYLQATWHPSTRPAALDFEPGAQWLGLTVRSHRHTGDDRAEVEFVARYRVGGRAVRLHERSRFVREAGEWLYVDGDQMAWPPIPVPQPRRGPCVRMAPGKRLEGPCRHSRGLFLDEKCL